MDVLIFLAAPFAACVVLVGILGYLGLHVLLREVIFVDLALAQIVAMGAVIAFFFGFEHGTPQSFAISLAAAVIAAAIFSWSRMRNPRIPQEAIIGITYVVASAATILVADRAPEGAEHIKELLAGTIIWVTWPTVFKVLRICITVGVIYFLLRRKFHLISEDPEAAFEQGMKVRLWDFLFYVLFGLVITVSVEIAGVLMVFAYLVAPSIIALASNSIWSVRIGLAWLVGLTASALGLLASYHWDLPSGPAIVCALGLLLLVFALTRLWRAAGTSLKSPRSDGGHG
jgi:zinc/manganese transport system permease protein